jgi:hypothetical protein
VCLTAPDSHAVWRPIVHYGDQLIARCKLLAALLGEPGREQLQSKALPWRVSGPPGDGKGCVVGTVLPSENIVSRIRNSFDRGRTKTEVLLRHLHREPT